MTPQIPAYLLVFESSTPALAIRIARRDWGRYDRLLCPGRGSTAGAKGASRS
jgi:hypothetical protein